MKLDKYGKSLFKKNHPKARRKSRGRNLTKRQNGLFKRHDVICYNDGYNDLLSNKEKMKYSKDVHHYIEYKTDIIGRFLLSEVGNDWDDVFSRVLKKIPKTFYDREGDIKHYVSDNGKWNHKFGLYVCKETNILKRDTFFENKNVKMLLHNKIEKPEQKKLSDFEFRALISKHNQNKKPINLNYLQYVF